MKSWSPAEIASYLPIAKGASFLSFVTPSSRAVTYCLLLLGVHVEGLAAGVELQPWPLWEGDRQFLSGPVWPTAGHSWSPSATCGICGVPWGKPILKGQNAAEQWVQKCEKQLDLWTLGRTTGEEVLQVLEQRFPCSSWRHPRGAASWEEHPRGDIHTADHRVPGKISNPHCSTWRIPCWRRRQGQKETAARGGPMLEHWKTAWR